MAVILVRSTPARSLAWFNRSSFCLQPWSIADERRAALLGADRFRVLRACSERRCRNAVDGECTWLSIPARRARRPLVGRAPLCALEVLFLVENVCLSEFTDSEPWVRKRHSGPWLKVRLGSPANAVAIARM